MEIIWHGHAFFEILTKTKKIAIDPFSEKIGLKTPRIKTDILLITHDHYDHNERKTISGDYFIIDTPGEYEVGGIFIYGVESFHDTNEGKERGKNTIYVIEAEDFRICHMGDFGQKNLTQQQKEKILPVDILMIPVGGVYTIGAKEAIQIINEIEPKVVIPMHYFVEGLNIKLAKVDEFLKAFGEKRIVPIESLKIKKGEVLPETTKVVLLEIKK
jgi:L-ascorbate metabolism protein UlaG (beta-lactamase superfamily)